MAAGNGDPADIRKDITDMAGQGIGRATYNELVLAQVYDRSALFGTPNWTTNFTTALEAGIENDLTIDALIAPGWSAGVAASPDSSATAKTLGLGRSEVIAAGGSFSGQIPLSALAAGVKKRDLQAVLAVQCATTCSGDSPVPLVRASVTDLTNEVTNAGADGSATGLELNWTAPSTPGDANWLILAFYSQGSGLRPVAGIDALLRNTYLADHFGSGGAEALIAAWEPILTPKVRELLARNAGAMWLDSLELTEATNWTPNLLDDFEQRRGYSLIKGLPAVGFTESAAFTFDDGSAERIQHDWLRTMSENFIAHHIDPLDRWADSLGMDLRYQTYSSHGPVAMIADDAWRALDIPEAETIDSRAVAAAAALSGADVVPTECCAFLGPDGENSWRALWPDMLYRLNQSLSTGSTLIEYHGFPQSNGHRGLNFVFGGPNAWPGWNPFVPVTGIGETWDTRQPSWDDQLSVNEYLGRSQFVLRQGQLKSDFLAYTEGSSGMFASPLDNSTISGAGYTWGYVSPAGLADIDLGGGRIAPDGPAYKAFVVNGEPRMSVASAKKILKLAKAGIPVFIVGEAPKRAIDTREGLNEDAALAEVISTLLARRNVTTVRTAADLPAAFRTAGVSPDAAVEGPSHLQIIQRRDAKTTYYWIFNASQSTVETSVTLTGKGRPYVMDAWSGAIEPPPVYQTNRAGVTVPVRLSGGETTAIAVTTDDTAFGHEQSDHLVTATGDVVVRDGVAYARSSSAATITGTTNGGYAVRADVGDVPGSQTLDSWNLQVESWGKPAEGLVTKKTQLDSMAVHAGANGALPGWDELPGLGTVSGLGTYTTTVALGDQWGDRHGAYLDLGRNPHTYRLTVNGHVVEGASQINPTRIDIGEYLKSGENTIVVRVSTTMRNAVLAQAPTQAGGVLKGTQVYGLTGPVRLLPYGESALEPTLEVTGEVSVGAPGGKVHLSVSVTNRSAVRADITVSTDFGRKTVRNVLPGKTVRTSVNTKLSSIPSGEAKITATSNVDGISATGETTVTYEPFPPAR
ncbi:hypothetical protein ASD56_07535 [Microbacterium sp. Root166]|nr:hypothetical protein ASD56_07535 [Microbacterium sp. Root166]